jgi:hypothetical protein
MLIRCAWCKRILGDKPPFGGKWDKEITDGICDDCLKKYFGVLEGHPLTAKAVSLSLPTHRRGETIGPLTGALREMLVAPTRSALEAKPHCWQRN